MLAADVFHNFSYFLFPIMDISDNLALVSSSVEEIFWEVDPKMVHFIMSLISKMEYDFILLFYVLVYFTLQIKGKNVSITIFILQIFKQSFPSMREGFINYPIKSNLSSKYFPITGNGFICPFTALIMPMINNINKRSPMRLTIIPKKEMLIVMMFKTMPTIAKPKDWRK